MILTAIVEALVMAGGTAEQILAVVRAHELQRESKDEERREKDRARKRIPNPPLDSTEFHGSDGIPEAPSPDGFISPTPPFTSLTPIQENPPKGGQKKVSQKATRLPSDWDLPVPWGEWAERLGMPRDEIIRECDKFKDYFIAKAGKDAAKMDWEATWRNWIRRKIEGIKS